LIGVTEVRESNVHDDHKLLSYHDNEPLRYCMIIILYQHYTLLEYHIWSTHHVQTQSDNRFPTRDLRVPNEKSRLLGDSHIHVSMGQH